MTFSWEERIQQSFVPDRGLKKNINHSIALKNWPSLCSRLCIFRFVFAIVFTAPNIQPTGFYVSQLILHTTAAASFPQNLQIFTLLPLLHRLHISYKTNTFHILIFLQSIQSNIIPSLSVHNKQYSNLNDI